MDLGIWSLRNADACFTLVEDGTPPDNLVGGDTIRNWSRIRRARDFLPHYLDQPLLFPTRCTMANKPSTWRSDNLEYILLSALSSSPNQLLYFPTKSGIPAKDKAVLRHWFDWGRKNIEYLKVRKDLPDWPTPGKVDGSAHIVGDRGLIFLFNPNPTAMQGAFALTDESIGLKGQGNFKISQEYPVVDREVTNTFGRTIDWQVPAKTAVVLRVRPIP